MFYSKLLGVSPFADTPYFVGFRIADFEIGLDPNAAGGAITYVVVNDIGEFVNELKNNSTAIRQDIRDVGNGLLIAQINDTDGNIIGLRQVP